MAQQKVYFARITGDKKDKISLTPANLFSKFKDCKDPVNKMGNLFFPDANKQIDFIYLPKTSTYQLSQHYEELLSELKLNGEFAELVSFVGLTNDKHKLALDGQNLRVKVLAPTEIKGNGRAYDLQISSFPAQAGQETQRVVLSLSEETVPIAKEYAELLARM